MIRAPAGVSRLIRVGSHSRQITSVRSSSNRVRNRVEKYGREFAPKRKGKKNPSQLTAQVRRSLGTCFAQPREAKPVPGLEAVDSRQGEQLGRNGEHHLGDKSLAANLGEPNRYEVKHCQAPRSSGNERRDAPNLAPTA